MKTEDVESVVKVLTALTAVLVAGASVIKEAKEYLLLKKGNKAPKDKDGKDCGKKE